MKRLNIICGAYGSGKTEFAIAYALNIPKIDQAKVGLVDLDIVNPYFRSRDVATELSANGITVISTKPGMEYADIPALSPRIFALFQDSSYQVVFDVGGDPAGARALGRFHQYFVREPYELLIVVNPFRPDTRNIAETSDLIAGIQSNSRLSATGLVSNINLGPDTTIELWREGLEFILRLAEHLALPVVNHMVEKNFLAEHRLFLADYPVVPVTLRMLPPWLQR